MLTHIAGMLAFGVAFGPLWMLALLPSRVRVVKDKIDV